MKVYLSDEKFLNVLSATPLVAIDLVLQNRRGEILLGVRTNRPAQGYWFAPGGRVRRDETLNEAFERLTLSELGRIHTRSDAKLLDVFEHLYDDDVFGAGIGTHYVVLAYHLAVEIEPKELPRSQHSEYRWWATEEMIEERRVHPNTLAYIGALDSSAGWDS